MVPYPSRSAGSSLEQRQLALLPGLPTLAVCARLGSEILRSAAGVYCRQRETFCESRIHSGPRVSRSKMVVASPLVVYARAVNWILGAGVLGVPFAFASVGILSASVSLIIVSVLSFLTCLWMLEVCSIGFVHHMCQLIMTKPLPRRNVVAPRTCVAIVNIVDEHANALQHLFSVQGSSPHAGVASAMREGSLAMPLLRPPEVQTQDSDSSEPMNGRLASRMLLKLSPSSTFLMPVSVSLSCQLALHLRASDHLLPISPFTPPAIHSPSLQLARPPDCLST
eukprot:3895564-Pleurochrysis_carterae.AAC.1